jgi:hypothetical protein
MAILSAMITPAVLILASGSLIATTSQRLGRVIDRTRSLSERFASLASGKPDGAMLSEEKSMLFDQLGQASQRSRLLQKSLSSLYFTLSLFVSTSVAIGLVAAFGIHYTFIPVVLGIGGAGLLLYASLLMIYESRIAVASVNAEMDYVLRSRHQFAPDEPEVRPQSKGWFPPFRGR